MPKPLAFGLIIVALLLGAAAGFWLAPEYAQGAGYEDGMGAGAAGTSSKGTERDFLRSMRAHHGLAIQLAEQAARASTRPEIKALAEMVREGMPGKIAQLDAYRKAWYGDARAVPAQRLNLGPAGANFDLRYLNAMIAHHEEAIAMAKAIERTATRAETLDLASTIISGDAADIAQFKEWRKACYGVE
jgi:uncharacterized protein (DUF305 family)